MTDREKFLAQARTYIGKNGKYVCIDKLNLGTIYDWCAFSVSAIMKDCGFIGKYIKQIEGGAGSIARESDGICGKWFTKTQGKPQAGDLILFRYGGYYSDKYYSDHVGIVESVLGNSLTTLEGNINGDNSNWAATSKFERKTRYLSDNSVYAFYRPNWGEKNKPIEEKEKKTSSSVPNVTYKTFTSGRWLPEVKNLEDYAGLERQPITGIMAKVDKGHIKYRVKLIGETNYLPWVDGYEDYAGIYGKQIDCIQMEFTGIEGYQVEYRVSTASSNGYLPWVKGYNNKDEDGYAGIIGSAIDKLEIHIVKK